MMLSLENIPKQCFWISFRITLERDFQKNITSGACVCNKASEYEWIYGIHTTSSIFHQYFKTTVWYHEIFMWGFRSIHYKLHYNSALGNSYDTVPMTCNCKMSLSVNGWQDKYRYDVANDLLSCSANDLLWTLRETQWTGSVEWLSIC